jgi:DNA-binding beta-propeller fold protein YncE
LQQIKHHQPAGVATTRSAFTMTSALLLAAPALFLAGCGAQYRPVVAAINPVGPAGQPTKYAVAVSSPSASSPGLLTFVDFSGDTVLSTPSILSNPSYFGITDSGVEGFAINASGSLNTFGMSNPTGLLTSDVTQTTLPVSSGPVSLSAITPANATASLFVPEAATSRIAILNANTANLLEELTVGANPVYVVGYDSAARVYAISQGATAGGNGQVAALEALSSTSLSVSATIPVGVKPVYGVMTTDGRRAFILNQGSGTVSVINVVNNALDSTTPSITLPQIAYTGGTAAPNPVWADLVTVSNEIVVLNQGDGVHPGTLSILSVPLCVNTTQSSNPNCTTGNPVDATGFGQIVANVPVGINPTMVSVLHDGSAAYVVNSGNAAAGIDGSVSVVNLVSGTVTATIPAVSSATATASASSTPGSVYGHPNSVSATTGTPTGKVYVTSPDNRFLTVIYTDTNTVQAHITMQGLGVRVLVTQP